MIVNSWFEGLNRFNYWFGNHQTSSNYWFVELVQLLVSGLPPNHWEPWVVMNL